MQGAPVDFCQAQAETPAPPPVNAETTWRLGRRMFRYARPHLRLLLLALALSGTIVLLEAIYLWIPASLVRTLFAPGEPVIATPVRGWGAANDMLKWWTHRLAGHADPYRSLRAICTLLLVAALLKNIGLYTQRVTVGILKLRMVRDIRNALYRHALRLPFAYFDKRRSGSIVSRVMNDVEVINSSIMDTLQHMLIEPVRILTFLGLMLMISPRLTLVVFALYPALIFGIVRIGRSVRRRSRRMLQNLSGLVSLLNETVFGMRAVKMFNRDRREAARFEGENQDYTHLSLRALRMHELARPVTDTLGAVITVLLLIYGGHMVLDADHHFAAEDFLRFLVMLIAMHTPMKAMARTNMHLQAGLAAAQRVFETLDEATEPLHPLDPARVPSFERALTFDAVSFRYPGHDAWVLREVSFEIPKGAVVALVGPSGSGKSTIMDCIPRFYDVSAGAIRLDGRDVRRYDLVGYRHLFGIVAQDTILFEDTVANNIAYGIEGASAADVAQAAEEANALDFIRRLPDGFETRIGERGITLSGGQRQRLAIARALLKDPAMLLLDEATSALDTESERLVQRALARLMRGRTTIVVAHRLSTVQHADTILVLDDGRIVERGGHADLLARNGVYRRIHDLQFAADNPNHLMELASVSRRTSILNNAAGMWQDRDDLPDFQAARRTWDRS